MNDPFHRRQARQLTYVWLAAAVVLGAISLFVPLYLAWFLRGVIVGMFALVGLVWIRAR